MKKLVVFFIMLTSFNAFATSYYGEAQLKLNSYDNEQIGEAALTRLMNQAKGLALVKCGEAKGSVTLCKEISTKIIQINNDVRWRQTDSQVTVTARSHFE